MNTIKFRGKREDNGEWVYGAFYPIKDERVYFIINNCQSIDFDDNSTFFNGYKVHKKSVGQFTGLHDKNGKEIYEGDIVTDGVGKYKIIYDLKLAGYQPYCIFRDDPENYCEVIGNIFENPEILEKKFAD